MKSLPRIKATKNKTQSLIRPVLGIDKTENFEEGALLTSENICLSAYPSIIAGKKKNAPDYSAGFDIDEAYEYLPSNVGVLGYKTNSEGKTNFKIWTEKNPNKTVGEFTAEASKDAEIEVAGAGNGLIIYPQKIYYNGSESKIANPSMTASANYEIYIHPDYIRFSKDVWYKIRNNFKAGDVVTIDGNWYYHNGDYGGSISKKKFIIQELEPALYKIKCSPNTFEEVQEERDMSIGTVLEKVEPPDIKNLSTFAGRVWGCDESGKIYASKYNDPSIFEYFNMTSADSFTLETDTIGNWTGSFSFGDHLLFFKEDKIHRITGTKPANFRHTVITTNGVKYGARKTLAAKDGILYYMGVDGVYAFAGGNAVKISQALGNINFEDGYAFFYKDIYYLTIKNTEGEELYGYDTKKRMWFKDGKCGFKSAFKYLGQYMVQCSNNKTYVLTDEADESRDMCLTFREWSDFSPNAKGFNKLYINAQLNGGKMKAEADFGFGFETVGIYADSRQNLFEIPLKPNRGEKISLRLTLSPQAVLRSIVKKEYYHGIHK